MTEPIGRHPRATSVIGYSIALLVGVLGLVARAVAAHNEGNSWVDVISVLLLIVAGMFAWLDRVRTRALARAYPTAFIAQVATDPTLASQADAFALQSTGKRTRLVAGLYMSIVADREEIRFFRGSRNPRQVAAFPSAVVRRVELGSSQAGARMIPCIDIVCEDGTVHGRLSLHLIRFGHLLPGFLRNETLAGAAARLRTASGID
jgi:hypothetical protein